jgi:hypothetical protein
MLLIVSIVVCRLKVSLAAAGGRGVTCFIENHSLADEKFIKGFSGVLDNTNPV